MALSITGLIADFEALAAEGKAALPALKALLAIAERLQPLVPVDDQAVFTAGVDAVKALVAILSKA